MINIEGLDKAMVLKVLYDNAKPRGLGVFPGDMDIEEARHIINNNIYFDYLYGRTMRVDLSSDIEFDPYYYDRYNGEGKAKSLIDSLR